MTPEDAKRERMGRAEERRFVDRLDRALNFLVALGLLVFLAPVMLIIALAVKLGDGGPALFAHKRIGLGGRSFYCLKFRSMAVDSEARLQKLLAESAEARAEWARDQKLKSDPRITFVGELLRKSSLDELPQLINVLRGEMSLVGPRPIVTAEIERYGRYFRDYCSVRPGITGLWQVSGRNDVRYSRRVAMDTVYSRTRTLAMDARILVMTVPAVLLRRGSY